MSEVQLKLGDKVRFEERNSGLFDALRRAGLLQILARDPYPVWGYEVEQEDGSVVVEAVLVTEIPE